LKIVGVGREGGGRKERKRVSSVFEGDDWEMTRFFWEEVTGGGIFFCGRE